MVCIRGLPDSNSHRCGFHGYPKRSLSYLVLVVLASSIITASQQNVGWEENLSLPHARHGLPNLPLLLFDLLLGLPSAVTTRIKIHGLGWMGSNIFAS